MTRINLLPWRESLRAKRQKEFGMMAVIAVVLTAFAMGYWHWLNTGLIDHQQRRNKLISAEVSKVKKQIKEIQSLEKTRSQLVARMNVVGNLQSSRPQIVHLFDELVTSLPAGVYLKEVRQANSVVTVNGNAQSNARVSAYMRGIDASPWLEFPKLMVIENKGEEAGENNFSMQMKQVKPKKTSSAGVPK